jgi:4a-hydroxytetrahydrobiopterin dehydratase
MLPRLGTTVPGSSLPVSIKKSDWNRTRDPESLTKTFSFRSAAKVLQFVSSLLRYENKHQHNAQILIDHLDVTITLSTKDLDKVTSLDLEYAKECDFVFGEID